MNKPSVGRVVHFYPQGAKKGTPPLAAIISKVHSEKFVNLGIFEESGVPMAYPPTSIRIVADGEDSPIDKDTATENFCCWPPRT